MKYVLVVFFLMIISFSSFAQKALSEQFFLFDANMKGIGLKDSASFIMRMSKYSDTLWQFDTYKALGPLRSSEQYRDEDATIPAGRFTFYHPTGYIDSTGMVIRGRLDGDWNFCNDTGKVVKQKTYALGKLIKTRDLLQEEKDNKEKKDSSDSGKDKDEVESQYAGGLPGWQRYLNKNIRYPERAINYQVTGMVIVQFMITTEGTPTDVQIYKSVEYSLDAEATRMILNSAKWKPAVQRGKLVKSYKRQPIFFDLKER